MLNVGVVEIGELAVRDDEVALSGVAEMGERAGRTGIRLAGPGFPGMGGDLRTLIILNYNYYIRVLLSNTNFLIYICHILCWG
jgi:hypothetical protein